MNALGYITKKFTADLTTKSPIKLTNINRTTMAQTLNELGYKVGAEIGVAEGYHAKILCDEIPDLKLYCVDVWQKYPGYSEYEGIEDIYKEAKTRLARYNCTLIKKFSKDAAQNFDDNSLDFVYIDAAHDFENVAIDVSEWSKKVRVGGIVFGHDFKRSKRHIVDVKDVIPGFCYAKGISPWFELANDIRDDTFGRDNPGWMFVRQKADKL